MWELKLKCVLYCVPAGIVQSGKSQHGDNWIAAAGVSAVAGDDEFNRIWAEVRGELEFRFSVV